MAVMVQGCLEADFDAATQTCSNTVWVVNSSVPPLTIDEANQIAGPLLLVLASAWCIRRLYRLINDS